jgi:hypothetical protein
MADKKISQLTAATTPLAGTEVLPIVQSASTVKVATDDLTVKNVRSNATSGILQVAGPGAGTTRTMTVPNANFTAARTDAAQTFTGDQTFTTVLATTFDTNVAAAGVTLAGTTLAADGTDSNISVNLTPKGTGYVVATRVQIPGGDVLRLNRPDNAIYTDISYQTSGNGGLVLNDANGSGFSFRFAGADIVKINASENLAISKAGKGIDFSANTHAAGMTSELLNWYETGTWTPTLTCSDGNFNSVTYDPLRGGRYTRVGNMVHVQCYMRTDAVDNTVGRSGDVLIAGLPFAAVTASSGTLDGHASLAVSASSAWAGEEPIAAFISGGDTNIQLLYRTAVDGSTSNTVAADVGTGANANIVLIAGTYICA